MAELPVDWRRTIGLILSGQARRVAVIGPPDSGKSSFCRAALAGLWAAGQEAALIDGDVGQKMVGPPATVSLAQAQAPGDPPEIAFVGATNPLAGFSRILDGVARLLDVAVSSPVVLNTSGLLAGSGRRLKTARIALLGPDLIVAVGEDPALDKLLAEHAEVPVVRLPRSSLARPKTTAQRRAARREGFRSYFADARVADFDLAACAADAEALGAGRLVGFRNADRRDTAMGVVQAVCLERKRVRVLAPARPAGEPAPSEVVPGLLRLDAEFRERPVERLERRP